MSRVNEVMQEEKERELFALADEASELRKVENEDEDYNWRDGGRQDRRSNSDDIEIFANSRYEELSQPW